jgi:hypothetical protein
MARGKTWLGRGARGPASHNRATCLCKSCSNRRQMGATNVLVDKAKVPGTAILDRDADAFLEDFLGRDDILRDLGIKEFGW